MRNSNSPARWTYLLCKVRDQPCLQLLIQNQAQLNRGRQASEKIQYPDKYFFLRYHLSPFTFFLLLLFTEKCACLSSTLMFLTQRVQNFFEDFLIFFVSSSSFGKAYPISPNAYLNGVFFSQHSLSATYGTQSFPVAMELITISSMPRPHRLSPQEDHPGMKLKISTCQVFTHQQDQSEIFSYYSLLKTAAITT